MSYWHLRQKWLGLEPKLAFWQYGICRLPFCFTALSIQLQCKWLTLKWLKIPSLPFCTQAIIQVQYKWLILRGQKILCLPFQSPVRTEWLHSLFKYKASYFDLQCLFRWPCHSHDYTILRISVHNHNNSDWWALWRAVSISDGMVVTSYHSPW